MDCSGKLQYNTEYSTGFSDDSNVVTKAYVDEVIKSYRDYNDYLAEQLNSLISYNEHIANKVDSTMVTVEKLTRKSMSAEVFFNDNTFEDYG